MDSPPLCKPEPPPKPSLSKLKEVITSERYFKENPVISRQKPPLAPKPVLIQKRVQRKIVSSAVVISQDVQYGAVNPSTSESSISRLSETQTVHYSQSSRREKCEQTFQNDFNSGKTVVMDANPQCDAEKIIQDTWASLQIKSINSCTYTDDLDQYNNGNLVLNKFIKNNSSLYSSECSKTLPLIESDSINKLVRSISDVGNTCDDSSKDEGKRPILQLSPPTPESVTGEFILVDSEIQPGSIKLPNESFCNDSSLPNSSFLYSFNESKSKNSDNSDELLMSSPENSTHQRLASSVSDNEVTFRNKKTNEHTRGVSWSEENNTARSRTNSIGNESFDGSNNSVRRRISSFFGSFGKGSKTKEKRESSLFYYNSCDDSFQMESSDSGKTSLTSLNDSSNVGSNNYNNSISSPMLKQSLQVQDSSTEGGSNRSSISDESFDAEQSLKSDNTGQQTFASTEDPLETKQRKCFYIVNELMTSERVFVDVLKLLCHDFKNAVDEASNKQKSPVIPSSDFNKIINNLPQLLSLNEDLLKDIESRIESWNELPKVADVIVKKGPFLKLYSLYIQNFEAQTDFLDDCCEKYRKFAQVVRDFEKSDRCKKLALKHYMLKPIQRIPQYRLLLDDYLKHQDPESPDYEDTVSALKIVCDVANHANRSIKQGDHFSKLLSIQSQLGDYEIIKPGRHFVKEGELYKLSRKEMQQRFFILLSDCLLYTTYYGSMTGLKVKYKLPLAGMKVSTSHSTDCATEFSIITSTRSFTLRAKSQEECSTWVEALQTAINDYNSRQMTFFNRHSVPSSASAEPLKIGREAPVWIQDQRVSMCQICTAEFTLTFRRHHCRACGKVVCSDCSDYKAPMLISKFNPVRVCISCYKYLLSEFDDMAEVIKKELGLKEEEVKLKLLEIRSTFKKIGQSSGKKIKKYIPQRLKEVTAGDSGSEISGWLLRRSRTRWKRSWFVLKEQVLYVYKASEDVVALQSIPVLGYTVEPVPECEFEELSSESKSVFKLIHPGQPPLMFATDSHTAERWISCLQEATLLK